jgi:hypothetical protein
VEVEDGEGLGAEQARSQVKEVNELVAMMAVGRGQTEEQAALEGKQAQKE